MQRHARASRFLARISLVLLPLLVPACAMDDDMTPGQPDAMVPDGPDIPRGQPLPPLAYSFAMSFDAEPWLVPRPETIDGHLYLDVGDDGTVTGVMSTKGDTEVRISEPTGWVDGHQVVLSADSIGVEPGGSLAWQEVRFSLADADGDGALDSATGTMSGTWTQVIGDIYEEVPCTGVLTAGPDTVSTQARLSPPAARGGSLLPHDAFAIQLGEPLRDTEVLDHLGITADGAAVDGTIEVSPIAGGWVASAVFRPAGFLPFGAEIALDLGALADPSGNPVHTFPVDIQVVSDPGNVLDNLGFEADLGGWLALGGDIEITGAFQEIAPAEGEAQAVLNDVAALATYLDVPEDASTLDFSVAVLSQFPDGYGAKVTLYDAGGGATVVFDVSELRDTAVPCDTCDPFRHRIAPLRPSIDLTPYRGQRVFLSAEVRATFFIGVEKVAMVIDDFRLQ